MMKALRKGVLILLGMAAIVVSLISLLARDRWWITAVKYPWQQITLASIVILALSVWALRWRQHWVKLYLALLTVAVIYQVQVLLPFTFLYPQAVADVPPAETTFALMVSNVRQSNRAADRYLALVEEVNPDVIQVIELNEWWQQALAPLREAYPYHFEEAHENAYGMGLYSRIPLENPEVYYFVNDETPALYAELAFPDGTRIAFYGMHPRPPLPSNQVSIADRELLQVANRVRTAALPVIVAGDFNDVPWSYTVEEFRDSSGLAEPRIGRGFYNTFGVDRIWLRFPLDHIYLSEELGLVDYARLPSFGSDHFALLAAVSTTTVVADN